MENKSCENCYYKLSEITQNRIIDLQKYSNNSIINLCALKVEGKEVCNNYSLGCKYCYNIKDRTFKEEATFKYNGKSYCEECCAKEIGVEIRPYTAYQFYDSHGEFIGDSDNMTLQDVLLNCSIVEYVGDED